MAKLMFISLLSLLACAAGQRITTIHLDGVQYFISRMNPYSPELNYFLAYQYCRSLGLQLASFETKEKAESMTTYLKNAGYGNYDFWTSGNRLGTGMFLWMSTGLPFNATFDFFENSDDAIQAGLLDPVDHNSNTSPQRTARDSSSGAEKGCVILKQPTLKWMPEDCSAVKDFICEQTRCYYYNYGSIPVSSAQGRPITSTTPRPTVPMMNMHLSTTPLPVLMSTNNALFAKKSPQQQQHSDIESQPSFVSLKLNHERALESEDHDIDGEFDAQAAAATSLSADEHLIDDSDAEEDEHDSDVDGFNEHARDLSDDVKDHVFPLNDNELHRDDVHSIEELQMQLQATNVATTASAAAGAASGDYDTKQAQHSESDEHANAEPSQHDDVDEETEGDADTDADTESDASSVAADDVSAAAAAAAAATSNEDDASQEQVEQEKHILKLDDIPIIMPSTTESPAIEVRLKQIAQDFEKMASNENLGNRRHDNNNNEAEISPQSSLSLSDLIRTLRPNDKQIIPQIDSDYSNAMRVLGKTSAVVNNEDSRKFKVLSDAHPLVL